MTHWTLSTWTDAALLAQQIAPDFDPPAAAAGQAPHAWFGQLVDTGTYHEAAMFLAHALPRYECVLWGAQALLAMGAVDRHDPLMIAVLRWLDQPGDALRRHAGELGDAARRGTPARTMALAVMASGGSIAPPDYAPVLPPLGVCALLVSTAVMSGACVEGDYRQRMAQALSQGEAIARGPVAQNAPSAHTQA